MRLVERHIITSNHSEYKQIDNLCFLSKNLYNSCLYTIKNHYEETGKILRYNELAKIFSSTNQPDFRSLPSATSQQIMMVVDRNLNSYFKLLKMWKKNPKSLQGCPRFPKYKHKTKGRNIIIFSSQQCFLKKDQTIRFPNKVNLKTIKTKVNNLCQVRIVPQTSCYVIEVVYEKQEQQKIDNNNSCAIDLGLNNLAALTFSNSNKSYLINGKPLKAINQYFNKKKALLQSELPYYTDKKGKKVQKHSSKKIDNLTLKRNNKINDYIHKTTRKINEILKKENISECIIGYNPEWKQGVNLGRVTNQNFVSIPFLRIIDKLKYKNQLTGINTLTNEESYTSKCSALDLEEIKKQDMYVGKRKVRDFTTSQGIKFNADINGSLNIGRKVKGNEYVKVFKTNKGYGQYPVSIKIYENI